MWILKLFFGLGIIDLTYVNVLFFVKMNMQLNGLLILFFMKNKTF